MCKASRFPSATAKQEKSLNLLTVISHFARNLQLNKKRAIQFLYSKEVRCLAATYLKRDLVFYGIYVSEADCIFRRYCRICTVLPFAFISKVFTSNSRTRYLIQVTVLFIYSCLVALAGEAAHALGFSTRDWIRD